MISNATILNAWLETAKKPVFDIEKITTWTLPYPFGQGTGTVEIPKITRPRGSVQIEIDSDTIYPSGPGFIQITTTAEWDDVGADEYALIYTNDKFWTWFYTLTCIVPTTQIPVFSFNYGFFSGTVLENRFYARVCAKKNSKWSPYSPVSTFDVRYEIESVAFDGA